MAPAYVAARRKAPAFQMQGRALLPTRHSERRYAEQKDDQTTLRRTWFKGNERWQQIALSEGWANYREEYLARQYLNEPTYVGTTNALLSPLVNMYKRLKLLGCSFSDLEKSLCTYSIAGYRDNLITLYPSLSNQITIIIKEYE